MILCFSVEVIHFS